MRASILRYLTLAEAKADRKEGLTLRMTFSIPMTLPHTNPVLSASQTSTRSGLATTREVASGLVKESIVRASRMGVGVKAWTDTA